MLVVAYLVDGKEGPPGLYHPPGSELVLSSRRIWGGSRSSGWWWRTSETRVEKVGSRLRRLNRILLGARRASDVCHACAPLNTPPRASASVGSVFFHHNHGAKIMPMHLKYNGADQTNREEMMRIAEEEELHYTEVRSAMPVVVHFRRRCRSTAVASLPLNHT